jgi:hypothetical protein
MSDLTRLEGKQFVDEYIHLQGVHAVKCMFNGCIVAAYEKDNVLLTQCDFINCVLTGDGWPEVWLETVNQVSLAPLPRPEKGKIV